MKANNPITARVQAAFKNLTTPTNQEVTLNADGSGGSIIAPDGRLVNKPKKKQKASTEDCGCAGSAKGAAAPAKQTNKKVLKAAKRGAKAKAKSEFKFAQANAKFDKAEGNISRKESRARIRHSRQDFRDAKKEIKDYVDY